MLIKCTYKTKSVKEMTVNLERAFILKSGICKERGIGTSNSNTWHESCQNK